MTAKELVLQQLPDWSEEQATAALRVVASQSELAAYLDRESKLSPEQLKARDHRWAEADARDAIREEPW
jgi:hypothetical protein